ncbi:MAG: hypothetical protein JWM78_1523 [Verrucomicrobiaceae bacterium]|nr:hypothetical protein [Verrucomicrobiaceae bacterium]
MAVVQEETTGCGIAAVANIVNLSYAEVKAKANSLGVFAEDKALFSDTQYVRALLREYGVNTAAKEVPFNTWQTLPELALLAIKYHLEEGRPFWHWVVFKREQGISAVLDSAINLQHSERTDFEAMQPEWFIAIEQ